MMMHTTNLKLNSNTIYGKNKDPFFQEFTKKSYSWVLHSKAQKHTYGGQTIRDNIIFGA